MLFRSTYGSADTLMGPEQLAQLKAGLKNAKFSVYEGIGHSTFWEDAPRFNRELSEFAKAAYGKPKG